MNELTLSQSLELHKNKNMTSCHTPGHKCNCDYINGLLDLDYTEIKGLDSLFEANSCILETENKLAQLYNSKSAYISAGGCTACIQTMLRQISCTGGKIICSRIIHESAINTMSLLNFEPIWVLPRADSGTSLPGRIYSEDIDSELSKNPDAKGVYLTSPDYYGVMSDIGKISKVCKKYNVPLLVDCAHGSHLKFFKNSLSPIDLGADLVAFSLHKTLPVLTGGALLCINNDKYNSNVKDSMALFASTSPSYSIMASIDYCRKWLNTKGSKEFTSLLNKVNYLKQVALNKGLDFPKGQCDPVRISLHTANIGLNAHEVADIFRSFLIEPEFVDDNYIVLILTPFNSELDFLRLEKAIKSLPVSSHYDYTTIDFKLPEVAISPHEAIFSCSHIVDTSNSINKIASSVVFSCPPGIPIVVPGERITPYTLKLLNHYGIKNLKVLY